MIKNNYGLLISKFFLVFLSVSLTACIGDDDDEDRNESPEPSLKETISGVAYKADHATDNFLELYWVDAMGNNTVNLDAPESSTQEIQRMAVSPSGEYVAYIKTRSGQGRALYAAPLDGSVAPKKINADLPETGMVFSFQWSADGSQIVYRADKDVDGVFDLYAVHPDGSGHGKLTGDTFVNGQITDEFQWAPDGSRIAFVAHETEDLKQQLYTVRPDGTGLTAVNGPLIAEGDVSQEDFEWSPDSTRLAYRADAEVDGQHNLYVASADGSDWVKLNEDLVSGGNVYFHAFQWSPDSAYLAWVADKNTDEVFEIFTARADGSTHSRLNPAPVTGGSVSKARNFQWAPDSSAVAFTGDIETENMNELFAANVDGSEFVKLNAPLPSGGNINWAKWGPDRSRIAYAGEQDTDGIRELYTVRPDGTDRTKISGTLVSGGNVVSDYYWSPDGSRVAFEADKDTDEVENLYTVRPDGTDLVRVSDNQSTTAEIDYDFEWTPNSENLVFRTDPDHDEVEGLYIGRADGSELLRLSLSQTTGDGVTRFGIAE